MYVFKGSPTTSATPCPGNMALKDDGTCPGFTCANNNDCLNGGTCNSNDKCECDTITIGSATANYTGIDCNLYQCIDDNKGNSLRGIVNLSGAAWSAM